MADHDWLCEVSRIESYTLPSSVVYNQSTMLMPGLSWCIFEEIKIEAANEDYSAFELKMMAEIAQRGISEPGAMK